MTMAERFKTPFKRRQAPFAEIAEGLWTSLDISAYEGSREKYQGAILEQYKIYVEMADRVTSRRALHNTFFLTVNTAIAAVGGSLVSSLQSRGTASLVSLLTILLLQCATWFWMIRSYRQLSSAKYRVIGALEDRLPSSPWLAEWRAMRAGRDKSLYWPLTQLEQLVPAIFGVAYIALFIFAVLKS